MSWRTPTVSAGTLHEPHGAADVVVGSPAWYAWLADDIHRCFHFTHPAGAFTARKERKQRGRWYWVAYRQVHGKLYKAYLGKSETLSEAHLCAVAQALTQAAGGVDGHVI
jgi:LuxR family maltose regulon positive regulatory protein